MSSPAMSSPAVPSIAQRSTNRTLALTVIVICQLMVILDATIVNIALPEIRTALHFSSTNLSWVISGYALAFGGLLLVGARAGDIFGRRRMFLGGIALFTLASFAGGLTDSSTLLLVARAAQGIGGAFASPSALALLMITFTEGRERTRALGLYTAVSIGGSAIGLILGGILTEWASWRWVFFVNVPIGVVLLFLAARALPETERRPGRIDLPGAIASTAGMSGLVFGIVRASSDGWTDSITLAALIGGAALLAVFAVIESRTEIPITPLRLFTSRSRNLSYLARLCLVAAVFGMFFFLTQFLQDVLGYSAVMTGLAFLPMTALLFATSQVTSRVLYGRVSNRLLLIGGVGLSTLGMLWLSQLSHNSGYVSILGPLLLVGMGNGASFVPLTSAGLAGVGPADAGAASGLVNVMQQVGGSLGLAILVTVFGSASRDAARHPVRGVDPAIHAFVAGADRAFWVSTGLLVVALLCAIGMQSPANPVEPSPAPRDSSERDAREAQVEVG